MIPKLIHYCWFGNAAKTNTVTRCINSWKQNCPDYQIIEWNEENFDVFQCPQYVIDAYENKKWAFVSDYVRLKVVYDNGGIYFDTDVELIKNIDKLLSNESYFGFEDGKYVATGLGFGAVKGATILREMMEPYETIPFILPDGTINQTTCPVINTSVLLKHGLKQNNKMQVLESGIRILPSIYLCPIDYETGDIKKSRKTISIHWFDSSWMSEGDKKYHEAHRRRVKKEKNEAWKHLPNRIGKRLIGEEKYKKLKNIFTK